MKILLATHFEDDYMEALLYWGLHQWFGTDDATGDFVVDWPWKGAYHGKYDRVISWSGAPWPWTPVLSGREWSDEEVVRRIDEFDVVVCASPRATNTAKIAWLIDQVGRERLRRFSFVDGEDYTDIHWNLVESLRPQTYFKTSLVDHPHENWLAEKLRVQHTTRVVPFPHACPAFDVPAVSEKNVDVAFLGGNHWRGFGNGPGVPIDKGARPALEALCEKAFVRKKTPKVFVDRDQLGYHRPLLERIEAGERLGYVTGHTFYHDVYMGIVNHAKISVVVGGAGIEPIRSYEAMACPGTMLLREDIHQIVPEPLVDGVNCATFRSGEELVEKAKYYLKNEGERLRVAAAGNEVAKRHHTPRALASRFLTEAFK